MLYVYLEITRKKCYTVSKLTLESIIMDRTLVAYFSASGVTAKVAEKLADAIGAHIHCIEPKIPYSEADLNWMDKRAPAAESVEDVLSVSEPTTCCSPFTSTHFEVS